MLNLLCVLSFLVSASVGEELPFPESRFDTVEGISFHYRQWDVPLAELQGSVLFIHGFAASTFSWRKNIDTFVTEGYRVVAVDVPPFGYSDRKLGMDQSPDGRARLLWKLLDDIDMKSRIPCRPVTWTLVGNSMGGGVAAAMAITRPERTAAVILVDPAIDHFATWTQRALARCWIGRRLLENMTQRMLADRRAFAGLLSHAHGRKADSAAVDGYLIPLRLPGMIEAIIDGVANAPRVEPAELELVLVPTLIVWGDNDRVIRPAEAQRLLREVPDSELRIIHGGGHAPMETEPAEFNALMLDFIRTGTANERK